MSSDPLAPSAAVMDDLAFPPETVEALANALHLACVKLNIPETRPYERDLIAARIIDLARTGLVDVDALCDRIVLESKTVF